MHGENSHAFHSMDHGSCLKSIIEILLLVGEGSENGKWKKTECTMIHNFEHTVLLLLGNLTTQQ